MTWFGSFLLATNLLAQSVPAKSDKTEKQAQQTSQQLDTIKATQSQIQMELNKMLKKAKP